MDPWAERLSPIADHQRDRDPYGRDRARVIHSAFFRRLQGKTQVLGLGESDFYRTRLTHSIEVAQIAGGIVENLREDAALSAFHPLLPSPHLIEAVALAHDIGHPPFGHGGEVALNYAMHRHGGFEGNAQTLRIATKLGEYSDGSGLNLTRRTLLGLLKYPVPYSAVVEPALYDLGRAPGNIDSYKPPKCVFDCDVATLEFIFAPFASEAAHFQAIAKSEGKHGKSRYKALDTAILELADDIAYGVHDLEDAVALRLVNERDWRAEVVEPICDAGGLPLAPRMERITQELFSGVNKIRKKPIGELVGYFIRSCGLRRRATFECALLDVEARMVEEAARELNILKAFVVKHVIRSVEVQTLEYKGQQMILRLFEAIANNPSRLLLPRYFEEYRETQDLRVICDYLAGTTDDYATRLYHKMFTPSSGSVFDRL